MKTRKRNNKGFSLIELIIAVAILVVLSGLLAPQLIKYVERSREAKDMQTLDSVYVAVNTALTNEKAYEDFTDGTYTDIDKGMTLSTLFSKGDAFTKEVQAVLGKSTASDVKLVSKRARAKVGSAEGVIIVQIRETPAGADGVAGLEVGVYAGASGTANGDFKVGNVIAGGSSTPDTSEHSS